mgnify:CR=1 FL=1
MVNLEDIDIGDLQDDIRYLPQGTPKDKLLAGIAYKQGDSISCIAKRHAVENQVIENWLEDLEDLFDMSPSDVDQIFSLQNKTDSYISQIESTTTHNTQNDSVVTASNGLSQQGDQSQYTAKDDIPSEDIESPFSTSNNSDSSESKSPFNTSNNSDSSESKSPFSTFNDSSSQSLSESNDLSKLPESQAITETQKAEIQGILTDIPTDDWLKTDLSKSDCAFLAAIHLAECRVLSNYNFFQSMKKLPYFKTSDPDRLEEQNYLEDHLVAKRKYYSLTKKGRDFLNVTKPAGKNGDVGEKTPHRVGVHLLDYLFGTYDIVDRTETYYNYHDGTVFDVVGLDETDDIVVVGEVELESNNNPSILKDYDKMAELGVRQVWLVPNQELALKIIDHLQYHRETFEWDDQKPLSWDHLRDLVSDNNPISQYTPLFLGFREIAPA